jgi:transposase InsO family protein
MDLITNLPPSKTYDGRTADCILSIVDYGLLKGAIFIPTTKTATANDITQIFISTFFPQYRLPDKIISDRGLRFFAKSIQALFKQLNITQSPSTTYHP